jgi:hypothetical protein
MREMQELGNCLEGSGENLPDVPISLFVSGFGAAALRSFATPQPGGLKSQTALKPALGFSAVCSRRRMYPYDTPGR